VSKLERDRERGAQTERRERFAIGSALGADLGFDRQATRFDARGDSCRHGQARHSRQSESPSSASLIDIMSALKKSLHAAEQKRADVARARRRWIREQGMLDPARLAFIDETATSTTRCGSEAVACVASDWSHRSHKGIGKPLSSRTLSNASHQPSVAATLSSWIACQPIKWPA
jgi:hypothetical protein